MRVSDYIVETLIKNGIVDGFGYPGGMVTYLLESFKRYKNSFALHINYHEQASSFSACGYASPSRPGFAYATSGPGATNLITGICNAYFDSIPTIFITGQVNNDDKRDNPSIRQRGFQETDIVSIVQSVTKYAISIENPQDIRYHLEKAMHLCLEGRPGPVLLDIPMNILRCDVVPKDLRPYKPSKVTLPFNHHYIIDAINASNRPCILIGAGVKQSGITSEVREFAGYINIPFVSSMIAFDVLSGKQNYFGFIGAYGHRAANMIIHKSDLVISLGSRLDIRQTGSDLKQFAPNAKLVRIDIDASELSHKIKHDECQINADIKAVIKSLGTERKYIQNKKFREWMTVCKEINDKLSKIDRQLPNSFISEISNLIDGDLVITTDVGQNQVWVAQSFNVKPGQTVLFSGGHGAMGYSLPAAIGAFYRNKKRVISFNGDGGLQMNIQELQTVAQNRLPIKIIVMNNHSLGMIRHFQEMYFNSNFIQTNETSGYIPPNFEKIANAYDIRFRQIRKLEEVTVLKELLSNELPCLIEIDLSENTYVYPKLAVGKANYVQDPQISHKITDYLLNL